MELIGELTLVSDSNLSSDETYAALQNATFVHFDALFTRHGYRRVSLEHGDARTIYYQHINNRREGISADNIVDKTPPLPPIPYVSQARYIGTVSGREVTLSYKTGMKNTWIITMDGLPGRGAR